MAFKGYLLKLGNYEFPSEYISAESYIASIITQDVDSNSTTTGHLKRNVVKHQPIKISFETQDGLTNKDIDPVMSSIRSNFITTANTNQEKKLLAKAYIPELGDYVEQEVYMKPDMEFPIDYFEGKTIAYKPISFVFVGY